MTSAEHHRRSAALGSGGAGQVARRRRCRDPDPVELPGGARARAVRRARRRVYAKGFLRSYAGYLGIDPAPLLEAYRAQERPDPPLFEHAPRAIGGLKTGRRGPNWLVVAIVCVSVILLVSLWGCCGRRPTRRRPAGVRDHPGHHRRRRGGQAALGHHRPGRAQAGDPDPALRRRLLDPGHRRRPARLRGHPGPNQRRTFKARRSLDVVLGYPAGVRLTVNGKDLGVPDRSGNIWRQSFTPGTRSLG